MARLKAFALIGLAQTNTVRLGVFQGLPTVKRSSLCAGSTTEKRTLKLFTWYAKSTVLWPKPSRRPQELGTLHPRRWGSCTEKKRCICTMCAQLYTCLLYSTVMSTFGDVFKMSMAKVFFFLLTFLPATGNSAIVNLQPFELGKYSSRGDAAPGGNYFTGTTGQPGFLFRSFFIFDISSVAGRVVSATLKLENPLFASTRPTELFTLHDYVGNLDPLLRNGRNGTSSFADLGNGTLYGSYIASVRDNNTIINMDLTPEALADMNVNARGGLFAIGGNLTFSSAGFIFGSSTNNVQLTVETTNSPAPNGVPEPGSLGLVVGGLLAILTSRRRRGWPAASSAPT